jgi:hypothetical protein
MMMMKISVRRNHVTRRFSRVTSRARNFSFHSKRFSREKNSEHSHHIIPNERQDDLLFLDINRKNARHTAAAAAARTYTNLFFYIIRMNMKN